jgi:myo-inositol-1-phosphate synthase
VEVPLLGVNVVAGPISDGLEGVLSSRIVACAESRVAGWENIITAIRSSNVDVLVNYLPVGALNASKGYAFAAARAGVAFVNCTPSALATDRDICEAFVASRTPLLGDDVKSHVGATLLHRILIEALAARNVRVDSTYQLNFGGNMDFFNMTDTGRVGSKRMSKSAAISSLIPGEFPLTVGPSGYIEHLRDRKVCFLNIQATTFLDASVSIEMKLEVEDSPNSAAVVIDAIRVAKLAMDRDLCGPISEVCAALFKSPPHRESEAESLKSFESFVNHC